MTCCRARGKVTAVGDGKKAGWAAFRVGPFHLRNYGLAWRTTGGPANGGRLYFLNSRLIKAADEFKHKTTAINKLWQTDGSHRMTAATATQNSLPSDFIRLSPSQRGPEFAGEGAAAIAG